MGTKEKLISKIEEKPTRTDISFNELKNYLSFFGFSIKRTKGDHVHFVNKSNYRVTIPKKKHMKAYVIELAVKACKGEKND